MSKKSDKPTRGLSYVTKNGVTLYWSEDLKTYVSVPDRDDEGQFPKVIGSVTTYIGSDKRFAGSDYRMLITGIFRRDADPDSDDHFINDNRRLAESGGVRLSDGAEVHVWTENEDRWGIVGEEIQSVVELECFADLAESEKEEP